MSKKITREFYFYNFIIIGIGSGSTNVLFKSKKKLDPNITLFLAVKEVFNSFSKSNKEIINSFNDKFDINLFNHHISSIECNNYDITDFYNDKETMLSNLDSPESRISEGEVITILLKNLNNQVMFSSILSKVSKDSSDDSKSMSTLTSSLQYIENTVFVKIISKIRCLQTGFHQFSFSSDEKFGDLLFHVLQYHTEKGFIKEKECEIFKRIKMEHNIT